MEYESVTQKVLFGKAVRILHQIKHFKLQFHIPYAVLFCCFQFGKYRPRKPRQQFRITPYIKLL
jgi:hypothetical protein